MLQFKTRDGTSPSGKAWVFLCALPEEVQARLAVVREDIFRFCNCAIWYDDGVDTSYDDLESAIAQSAMAVLPVTAALLDPCSPLQRRILPLLQTYRVSILPVLDDPNLLDAFNACFRNIQFLDRYSNDQTAIPYEAKLERFLDTMLLKDDLAERVHQVFRSQLFLSYRKKDRALALELMKQIHKDPRCRNISLWYDEFLTPGEAFDENIDQAIQDSDLFLLALTQNMVKEDNYVIREEFPLARDAGKKILPVALEAVDCDKVQECFPGIPPLVDSEEIVRYLAQHMDGACEPTAEQDYLLGLAFIHGFYVERHVKLGLEQLERSVQRGYAPAALQLANIQILEHNPEEQKSRKLRWLRKYAALTSGEYKQNPCSETGLRYADALDRAAEAEFEDHPETAFILYKQAIRVLEHPDCLAQSAQICSNYGLKLVQAEKNQDGLQMLLKALQQYAAQYKKDPQWAKTQTAQFSYCYYNTANAALQAGELELAKSAYTAAIQNFTILAREKPEEYTLVLAQAHGNLANLYRRLWVSTGDPEHCALAEAYHSRAINILNPVIEWAPEVYEPAFALELVSLAAIYVHKPDYKKAELALDNGIKILQHYEECYPGQHIDNLAGALGNRAVLSIEQKKIESARRDLNKAITILRKASCRHMDLAMMLCNMAITYSMTKDYGQARQYFEEAAAIYESGVVQGSEHCPDYAQCCHNFANTLYNSGDYRESLIWANRAIEIYRKLQGSSGESYATRIEALQRMVDWMAQMI